MKHVPIMVAAARLDALISEVRANGEAIVLTQEGEPVATLSFDRPETAPPARVTDAERAAILQAIADRRDDRLRTGEEKAVLISWEELRADMEAHA